MADVAAGSGCLSLCELCTGEKQPSKYVCSRCGKKYCSLKCFKSEIHQKCSEMFYKENVQEQMSLNRGGDDKDKLKLIKVLDQYQGEGWRYEAPLDYNKVEDELDLYRDDLDEEQCLTNEEEKELKDLIENATPDQLLKIMTPDEKKRFEELLHSGKYEITD